MTLYKMPSKTPSCITCRCTMIAAVQGVDTSDAQRRARNPETEEEAQELVDRYACTGNVVIQAQKDGAEKITEYVDVDKTAGKYFKNNAYHDTKRIGIFYSKREIHVVPTDPEGRRKNG